MKSADSLFHLLVSTLVTINLLWVISTPPAFAKEREHKRGYNGYDIVTMKNGDIHQGTVAIEKLTL